MKRISLLTLASVMVLGLIVPAAQAQSEWKYFGVGWYSPDFGEINEELKEMNRLFDTDLRFSSNVTMGVGVEYELSKNFSLRGEMFSFVSETSDKVLQRYWGWEDLSEWKGRIETTPVILSWIYKFKKRVSYDMDLVSPYIGLGIGVFPTKLEFEYERIVSGYNWTNIDYEHESDRTYPIGFQLIFGLEFDCMEILPVTIEGRYIFAEAEMDEYDVDLSGGSVSIGLKF